MKEYLELCLEGESTIIPRKEMLKKKQEALRISIKELEDSVAYIDWKQNFYDEVLSGQRPYISNLIRSEESPRTLHLLQSPDSLLRTNTDKSKTKPDE